jgi:hypothetical protein
MLRDVQVLEEFQMYEQADVILRMFPQKFTDFSCDFLSYLEILVRNMTPETVSHMRYHLKKKSYILVDEQLPSLMKESIKWPVICQINFWKIVNSQKFECFKISKEK